MFRQPGHYGACVNSFDLVKLLALSTMIIDHLGYHIWQDSEFLRVVGRTAFPLFLFLVGYSASWKIRYDLWFFAAAVAAFAVLTGHHVFPLNVLATIGVTRLVMGRLTRYALSEVRLAGIFLVCVLWYPLMYWCDYSSLALLFALSGYLQRTAPGSSPARAFFACTLALHALIESIIFAFSFADLCGMLALLTGVYMLMRNFTLRPVTAAWIPYRLQPALCWLSRNTLPIYALHLIILMIVERAWFPERFDGFHWL